MTARARAAAPGSFSPERPASVTVLISGRGSNLEALIAAQAHRAFRVTRVIADDPAALGLERAERLGVAATAFEPERFRNRGAFEDALGAALDDAGSDLICLAGFMRVLGAPIVERFRARMLNIHPSLLPAFKGLDTHRRALEAGVAIHGCSVHLVTPALDAGPILAQAATAIAPDDDAERLGARVLMLEHRLYAHAIDAYAQGALRLEGGRVVGSAQRGFFAPIAQH